MSLQLAVRLSLCAFVVALASSCPKTIGTMGCESARDCEVGQLCTNGECLPAGSGPCTTDSQCNAANNEVCFDGTCQVGEGLLFGGCI